MSFSVPALRRAQFRGLHVSKLPMVVIVAMGVVSIVSLLMLIQTSGVTTIGYDVQRLEETRNYWREQNTELEKEVALLQSLDRVDREARARLRMIPAGAPMYVVVDQTPSREPKGAPWKPWTPAPARVQAQSPDALQAFLSWLATISAPETARR
ncbi:MAG: septum formation initiator family protein [Dehalococcoidia bacterium]|nr:septum formation initiator family protein [Dehalococcoidia bacterium]